MNLLTAAEKNAGSHFEKLEDIERNRLALVEKLDKLTMCSDEDYRDVVLQVLVAWVRLSRQVGVLSARASVTL